MRPSEGRARRPVAGRPPIGSSRHGQRPETQQQGSQEAQAGEAEGPGDRRSRLAPVDPAGLRRAQGLSAPARQGAGGDWSSASYLRFEDERTRPARDLAGRLPEAAGSAADLGCGPGNSTELLVARYPAAAILGIDTSPDMLAAARRRLPGVRFEQADIAGWHGPERFDVIFANASLQWLPDHAALFPALLDRLAPGGTLAVQMPDNLDEPTHRLMREVAAAGPWAARLAGATAARADRHPADWYWRLMRPRTARLEIWRTTYHHPLAGPDAVVDWLRATGLRPFLAPLAADEAAAFLDRYRAAIAAAYPAHPDGTILLPFPRLFLLAAL